MHKLLTYIQQMYLRVIRFSFIVPSQSHPWPNSSKHQNVHKGWWCLDDGVSDCFLSVPSSNYKSPPNIYAIKFNSSRPRSNDIKNITDEIPRHAINDDND